MIPDLVVFAGAVIGAFLNRAAGHNATRDWRTLAEVLGAGAAMVLLSAVVGVFPEEFKTAMWANPIRTGLSAFFISLVMGPGLVTLTKSVFFRLLPILGNGGGGNGGNGTKVGAILLIVSVLSSGCGVFGKPADDVVFNRGQFAVVAIRLAELHGTLTTLGAQTCSGPKPPAELCVALAQAESRYQDLKPQVERAITDPRTVPDWAAITRGLELLAGTVALVAGFPGVGALLPKAPSQ